MTEHDRKNTSCPAILLKDVSAGYGDIVVQRHLNFSVSKGEIVTLLGGSGCGKSTVLKTIIGLQKALAGDILIDGESIVRASGEERLAILRKFGVAFQGGALFQSYTVGENVALPLQEYTALSKSEIRDRVHEKLALVGLDGAENKFPHDLSGGMVKRAAVARALALDPEIIFLDEPSAGLDPISSVNLDHLIMDLRDRTGSAVLVVTHELESIFTIADRALFIDRVAKTLIAEGPPAELRDHSPNDFVRNFFNRGQIK